MTDRELNQPDVNNLGPADAPAAPAAAVEPAARKLIDLATFPRDFRAQEIHIKDRVVYARRKTNDLYLTEGTVVDRTIGPAPSIVVQPGVGRRVRLRNLHTVVVVPPAKVRR